MITYQQRLRAYQNRKAQENPDLFTTQQFKRWQYTLSPNVKSSSNTSSPDKDICGENDKNPKRHKGNPEQIQGSCSLYTLGRIRKIRFSYIHKMKFDSIIMYLHIHIYVSH